MLETSSRMLAMLALLQSRPDWPGSELAERLGVSTRTIRNDVERLRELGYPVDATRGPLGHYRLGAGAKLPPLLLDDEEAVAVAVGLRAARGVHGIEESSARALSKLEQVLPHRVRRQVAAIAEAVAERPADTSGVPEAPPVGAAVLARLASLVRDHELVRFDYRRPAGAAGRQDGSAPATGGLPVTVEPYRLVSWVGYWYLVARDTGSGSWHAYRVDWLDLRMPTGRRFTPAAPPTDDLTGFVLRDVAYAGWRVHVRITVLAPAEEVLARINPTVGVVEAVDADSCVLVTGGDSLEIVAVYIGMLGLDFRVAGPPELVEHLALLGERYRRSVDG